MEFAEIVRNRLDELNVSPIKIALENNLPRDAIRSVLRGHPPNINRAKEIAKALGMCLNISLVSTSTQLYRQKDGDTVHLRDSSERAYRSSDIDDAEHVMVPKLNIKLSSDHRAMATDEQPLNMLAFRREWMQQHNLHPSYVSAVEIQGDSMEPTLRDGDTVLVDHQRVDLKRGLVVAARVDDELYVKRLKQYDGSSGWLLSSDNHAYETLTLKPTDAVIGEIVWQGCWWKQKTLDFG